MAEKQFPEGVYFNLPRQQAPEYVVGEIGIKVSQFDEWFARWRDDNGDTEILRLDVMIGRSGKPYVAVNTFKPGNRSDFPIVRKEIADEDIPF